MTTGLTPRKTGSSLSTRSSIFSSLQNEMNRLFDDFDFGFEANFPRFAEFPMRAEIAAPQHQIKLDLRDAGDELVLTAEVPGMDLNDLMLAVTPHYLSLSGEKKNEESEHEKQHYRTERSYGFFRRVVPLPCEIDKNRVDAVYKDGVLRISLPKTKEAITEEKKISVKAG
jgi:HSP20 family protein